MYIQLFDGFVYVRTIEVMLWLLVACLVVSDASGQPPDFNFASHFKLLYQGTLKFAVYLEHRGQFLCPGVIVSDQWVITAANCLHRDGLKLPEDAVSVVAGSPNYKNVHSSNIYLKQERVAKKIYIHPDFVLDVFSKSDIALVKVNETFDFTHKSASKINISNRAWPEGYNRSRTCLSFGFGDFGPGAHNTQLKLWNTTALYGPHACPCTKRFQWQRLLCRQETEGIGLCAGDTGGGLLCYDGQYPVYQDDVDAGAEAEDTVLEHTLELVGIAHMTMDQYMCEYRHVPQAGCSKIPPVSTYMFLCPFNDWISRHIPDTPPGPDRCRAPPYREPVLQLALAIIVVINHVIGRQVL